MKDGGRILIVDDLPTNRLKLSLGLKQQGYISTEAENGCQALSMLRAEPYDLVLLDVVMPEMDGYEVLQEMKRDKKLRDVPVIVISAHDELDSVIRGIELGAEDYLPKSFEPVLLKARIGACLEKKWLRDREQEKIRKDSAVAREIQRGALPRDVPAFAGYELAAWTSPAEKTGGDIYDLIPTGGQRVALLVADATGHGIAAALSATQVQSMFRMGMLLGCDLGEVLSRINTQLQQNLPSNHFVTVFGAVLDCTEGRVCYHSWGQAPLIYYEAARDRIHWLEASVLPMGILSEVSMIAPVCLEIHPGDLLAVISDGVFEYENHAGEEFGHDRVGAWLRTARGEGANPRMMESLGERIREFAAGAPQEDDMTAILIRRTAP